MGKIWEQLKSDFMKGYNQGLEPREGRRMADAPRQIVEETAVSTGGEVDRVDGNLMIRHIPAGTPEPEKTALQKLIDLLGQKDLVIQGLEEEIRAWRDEVQRIRQEVQVTIQDLDGSLESSNPKFIWEYAEKAKARLARL